ncbi:MAG TPA: sigma-70 family RNA polymerase sigma factor [Candidatus Binatus sp.]|jgi:RNA polymerase sigma-70 factor (ECF subfamily)|nr:sigma-70 family RNA polymerase sigma factor [Candidatus Binatus sp.]
MKQDTPDRSQSRQPAVRSSAAQTLAASPATIDELFAQSKAGRWGLSRERFAASLERSAEKRLASGNLAPEKLDEYLSALHLEDLALAAACMENCEPAWEDFVRAYRPYLRAAAAAVLRCSSASPEACELADSLFAELYGLADGARRERSLFRYFHGRSSLKTWLRAVLAQRHIDAIRAGRRFESIEDDDAKPSANKIPKAASVQPSDPYRERYVSLFISALQAALTALDPRDEQRLRLYYAKEQTLAEIGRQLAEHESSVSRNLDRIRLALRHAVEETLRNGCPAVNGFAAELGLSDAQISLCFEYASADAAFDLEKLLQRRGPSTPARGRPGP